MLLVHALARKVAPRLGTNAALVVEGWVANEDLFVPTPRAASCGRPTST